MLSHPDYKNLLVDRTVAGGELGVEGKTLTNLETLYVRMAGARYDSHGVRFNPTSLLTKVDSAATLSEVKKVAARHADSLVGIAAVGYDTPSYGHGEQDENGTPLLLRGLCDVATDYDVPYIVDTGGSIRMLISSGALFPREALLELGLMDEGLFIDHIDTEWFLRAKDRGWRVFGVCDAVMDHGLGERTVMVWLGRWRYLPVHQPFRYYYIYRNSVLLYRRSYPQPSLETHRHAAPRQDVRGVLAFCR